MRTPIYSTIIAVALPLTGFAQDKTDPGKASDAVKNPAAAAPAAPVRTPNASERDPGKASDAVTTPDATAGQRKFAGAITAVSRDEKTITINDAEKGSHKLHISETTKLKRGEKAATWDDLKVGAKVDGTCRAGKEKEPAHAVMLNIGA